MLNFKRIAFIDPFAEAKDLVIKNQNFPMTQIGTGACFDVYALETSTRKIVVKKWKLDDMQEEVATNIQEAYYEFQNALEEMGIAVAKTELYFQRLPDNKQRLWIFQEYCSPEYLLEYTLSTGSQTDIIAWFKKLVSEIMKLAVYNESHKARIGIDIKPPNYSIRDGSLLLIDNFPFPKPTGQDKTCLPFFSCLDIFSRDFSNLYDNIIALYVYFILCYGSGLKKDLEQVLKTSIPENTYKTYTRKALLKSITYKFGKKLRVIYRLHLLKFHFYRILDAFK